MNQKAVDTVITLVTDCRLADQTEKTNLQMTNLPGTINQDQKDQTKENFRP